MNYKKIILAVSLGITAIAGFFFARNKFQKPIVTQVTTVTQLKQFIAVQEQIAWNAMESLGISKDRCYQLVQEWEKEYNQTRSQATVDKNLSKEIRKQVQDTLKTYGVDSSKINIERYDKGLSAAGATNDTIVINQQKFSSLPQNAQQFVLAHEVQHIIYKDAIAKEVIKDLLKIKSTHSKDIDSPLNQLSRFFEIRADVMASIKNPVIAQGYVKRAHLWLAENGYNPGTSHPKHEERLALAQQITQLHQSTGTQIA